MSQERKTCLLNFCRRKVCRRFQGTLYFGRIIFIPEMRRTDIRSITALLSGKPPYRLCHLGKGS